MPPGRTRRWRWRRRSLVCASLPAKPALARERASERAGWLAGESRSSIVFTSFLGPKTAPTATGARTRASLSGPLRYLASRAEQLKLKREAQAQTRAPEHRISARRRSRSRRGCCGCGGIALPSVGFWDAAAPNCKEFASQLGRNTLSAL